ncbi:MAG: hypothetical protein JXR05_08835 [Flavobacteriaceae bacterium]
MRKKRILTLMTVLVATIFMSCSTNDDDLNQTSERQFGIFKVLSDDTTIEMDGTINSSSLVNFNRLAEVYPNINKINIKNCDGSSDDNVNLQVSAKVHQKGMNIHLMDNGEIASGGVDFFIAGRQRTKGNNTRIGVHSWAGGGSTATDFPVGHANHLPYINYYVSVGFTQQQSEAFYYFTINAAPASSIHWMTDAEIAQYNLITQ